MTEPLFFDCLTDAQFWSLFDAGVLHAYRLPVEVYRGKPIFYGLGSFSFHTGHGGRKHGDWVGELARVVVDSGKTVEAAFRLVRHNESNETYFCDPRKESQALGEVTKRSEQFGTRFTVGAEEISIGLQ